MIQWVLFVLKEELGSLIDGWQVEKLELDERGFTCDFFIIPGSCQVFFSGGSNEELSYTYNKMYACNWK